MGWEQNNHLQGDSQTFRRRGPGAGRKGQRLRQENPLIHPTSSSPQNLDLFQPPGLCPRGADRESRLCLPREGYPPEVISCFSRGGRQERARPEQKLRRFPSMQPRLWPQGQARKGTGRVVCPNRLAGWSLDKKGWSSGVSAPPSLCALGFPKFPSSSHELSSKASP